MHDLYTFYMYIMEGYLGDISGLVPDHLNKLTIAIKQVLIFLLMEGFAFDL